MKYAAALGYSAAISSVLAATGIRLALGPLLGGRTVFLPFTLAVIAAVYVGGRKPGLVAAILSLLTANYLFISPRLSLAVTNAWDRVAILEFAVVSLVIIELSGRIRTSMARAAENQATTDALLNSSSQAIIAVGEDGCIEVVNARAESMFGYEPGELIGKPHELLIPEALRERHRAHYENFVAKPRPRLMSLGPDLTARRKDGSEFPVEITLNSVKTARGTWSVSFVTDTTARRRLEQSFQQQYSLMSAITECAAEGLFLLDRDGRVTFANPAAEKLLGWTASELRGAVLHERIHYQHADGTPWPRQECPLEQVLATSKAVCAHETTYFRKDGTPVPVSNSVAPIVREGRVEGIVVVVTDITERQRSEEALRRTEQRVRVKLESILSPEGDIAGLQLGDILDLKGVQSLMDDLYQLARIPMGVVDLDGNLLISVGFQEACTRFHRMYPESRGNCIESDMRLSSGVAPGEFKLYRCLNHMSDMATPLIIGGKHAGNLFCGQFFLDDEPVDLEVFRSQAAAFGFPSEEYIAAIKAAPRLSRKTVETAMAFLMKLGQMLSLLSYGNIKLARSLAEQDRLLGELKARQEKLQESEERVRLAIDSTGLGVFDSDLVTGKIVWSAEAKKQFGMPLDAEVDYGVFVSRLHPDDRAHVELALAEAQRPESGGKYLDEYRAISAEDGQERWFSVWGQIFFDERQRPIRLLGVRRDITDRKHAGEKLRDSEARLRTLGDNLPEGAIYRYRQNSRGEAQVEFISAGIERLTGVPAAEFMADAETVSRSLVPEDVDRLNAAIVLSREQLSRFEVEVRHKHRVTGEMRWSLMRSTPSRCPDGSTVWDGIEIDITDRKRAEEAIRIREQTLRRFIQAAPVAIAMFDQDMRYLAVSQRYLDDYGLGVQDLMGRSHYEVFPEIPEEWRLVHRRCMAGTVAESPGERFLRADGTEQWMRWAVHPWRHEAGTIGGLVLFSEDISQQKLAEQAVGESEERFRALVTASSDAVYRVSPDWAEMRQLSGRGFIKDTTEPNRAWIGEYIHPSDQPRVWAAIQAAIRDKRIFELEHRILRVDGTLGWTFSRAVPLQNAAGEIVEWFGAASDITPGKQAQAALQASEEQFRTLANAIPHLCWMANADGWIFWYNERWYEYTGTTPAQMEGWGWQSVHDPEALPNVLEHWRASIDTGEPFDMVFPLRGNGGVFRPFLTRVMPVRDGDGKIVRWFGTNTDISEQREIAEALRESRDREIARAAELQALMDAMPVAAFVSRDAECHEITGNRAAYELLRLPLGVDLSRTVSARALPMRRAAASGQAVYGYDCELQFDDGSRRQLIGNAVPMFTAAGASRGSVAVFIDITERKKAEEALKESEQRYRSLVEQAVDAIFLHDYDGRFVDVNQRACESLGYAREELLRMSVLDVECDFNLASAQQVWNQVKFDEPMTLRRHQRRKDGTVFPVEIRFGPCTVGGRPLCMGLVRDTSERERMEEARRKSEERYRTLFDSIPEASAVGEIICDPAGAPVDWRYLDANPAFETRFALRRTDIVGRTYRELFPDSPNWKQWTSALGEVAVTRQPAHLVEYGGGQGSLYDAVVYSPAAGQFAAIFIDVTERKRAEKTLRRQAELINLSHDAIFTMNAGRIITTWNAGAAELYGWSEAEAVGQVTHGFLQTRGQTTMAELDAALRQSGRWDGELQHTARDGSQLWVDSCQVLETNESGTAVLEINRDITARKRAEEELRRLNLELEQRVRDRTAQLEAANKELEAFAYSVSHDLRAPLRGIDGWSLALLEDYGDRLDGGGRKHLEWVRSEAQRMGAMIEDLLQLSRVTRSSMQQARADLTSLANAVAGRLRAAAPGRVLAFEIQTGMSAWGDPRLLEIALTNLLDNAVKYTGRCPEARIQIGQSRDGDAPAFYVKDNGAGFDPELAAKLFTAFQRLHKPADFPGNGIGLATVQRIIHRHGGRVWAEAAPGKGATFYFTLPER